MEKKGEILSLVEINKPRSFVFFLPKQLETKVARFVPFIVMGC